MNQQTAHKVRSISQGLKPALILSPLIKCQTIKNVGISAASKQFSCRLKKLANSATRNESGGALIELALAVSLTSTLLLGAAEFGRLAYAGIEISNAAHAGAAYGSESHTTAADTANIKLAATQDAPDISGLSVTSSYACSCADGTTSTCLASDCSTSRILVDLQVNTQAKVDPLIYVPGLPKSYTLKGYARMKVVQ